MSESQTAARRATVVGAVALLIATAGFFPRIGSTTQALGDVATVRVPRRTRLDPPRLVAEHASWVAFRMDRVHAWAIGSDTPYRASLFLGLHAPGASPSSYDEALSSAAADLNGGWDDWVEIERSAQWSIGSGRYTVNMLNEPTWRLAYRDPARRVSVLWQVFQRDWSLDAARRVLVEIVGSMVRLREPDFAEIADRPRREAAENDAKAAAALAWLAARGFAPLDPGEPIERGRVTAEYMRDPERRIMLYAPTTQPSANELPAHVSPGQWAWSGTTWEPVMPTGDYYPMPGTRRLATRHLLPPGPHHFLIRTIRLDEWSGELQDLGAAMTVLSAAR